MTRNMTKFTVAVLATLAALAVGLALTTAPAKAATVPPGGCGIVIKDTIKETVVRTSEGQIVRLSDKVNVLIFRPKAGHLVACWDEKTPEPRR